MMKFRECRVTRREIDQAEDSEQLSAHAQNHVETCAACSAFQDERERLRAMLTSLEPVTAPEDFDFRLRARIASQGASLDPRSFFGRFVLSTPAIAVAAVVVLAVSVLWFAQHRTQTSAVATTAQKQTREGDAASISNSLPQAKETRIADSTTTTAASANQKADAPIYLVRSGKLQLKETGSMRAVRSTDLSASSASSIRQGQNGGEVSVRAPLNPFVLSFQDEKGTTRTVSLPPVSFGSQRLLESRVVPVSLANGRVW